MYLNPDCKQALHSPLAGLLQPNAGMSNQTHCGWSTRCLWRHRLSPSAFTIPQELTRPMDMNSLLERTSLAVEAMGCTQRFQLELECMKQARALKAAPAQTRARPRPAEIQCKWAEPNLPRLATLSPRLVREPGVKTEAIHWLQH